MNIFESWLAKKPIAHRGLHNEQQPENSLAAFENAIKHGYPIELDVRPIDDGTVVVFHDSSLNRMCNADGYVSKLKSEDLKSLKLLGTEQTIPTLREVLDFVDGRVPILIEIKNDSKVGAFELAVAEQIKDYKGEFAVQSFNPYVLEFFRNKTPNVLRGQLASFFKDAEVSRFKKAVLKRMLFNKTLARPNFISYEFCDLPNRFVNKYKSIIPVLAWTVKSNDDLEKVKGHCDNVIFEGFVPQF